MMQRSRSVPERGGSRDVDLEAALEALADEYTQSILQTLAGESLSAPELTERCDASRVTVYRRLNRLEEIGLVTAEIEIDPDGNHRKIFTNVLEKLTLSVCADGVEGEMSTVADEHAASTAFGEDETSTAIGEDETSTVIGEGDRSIPRRPAQTYS